MIFLSCLRVIKEYRKELKTNSKLHSRDLEGRLAPFDILSQSINDDPDQKRSPGHTTWKASSGLFSDVTSHFM
jgi:hypothetical protein